MTHLWHGMCYCGYCATWQGLLDWFEVDLSARPAFSFREILHIMGWLRLVGSLRLYVSSAEYGLFYRALLQKWPVIIRSLLIVATSYLLCWHWVRVCVRVRVYVIQADIYFAGIDAKAATISIMHRWHIHVRTYKHIMRAHTHTCTHIFAHSQYTHISSFPRICFFAHATI